MQILLTVDDALMADISAAAEAANETVQEYMLGGVQDRLDDEAEDGDEADDAEEEED